MIAGSLSFFRHFGTVESPSGAPDPLTAGKGRIRYGAILRCAWKEKSDMKHSLKAAYAVLCCAILALSFTEALADMKYGDWTYVLNDNGQIVITGYSGKDRNLAIPWNLDGRLVVEIGPGAFMNNGAIESVKLPIGVTILREDAFRNCMRLKSVTLPSRLSTIEDGVFVGCISLLELSVPESVAEFGEVWCDSHLKLLWPENTAVDSGPVEAYQYEIRNGGAVITSYTGEDSEVIIPTTLGGYPVRVIGENAFSSRYSVERVVVPEGVVELERISFRYCHDMAEIVLPSTLRIIGDNAFYRCERLTQDEIPEGVVELGNRAFQGCGNLYDVTLPMSLESIPWYAFTECSSRLVIHAPAGSAAQAFARNKGYNFNATR